MTEYFKRFGDVKSSNVVRYTIKMKNCGFVVYDKLNSYEDCLKVTNHKINNREINVKKANQPFICKVKAQLPSEFKSKREEITTYFEKFGKVVDIDFFIQESEVLIRYKDRESVIKLLNQKNHELGGEAFTVKELEKKKKTSKNCKVNGAFKNQQQKQRAPKRKSQYNHKQQHVKRQRTNFQGTQTDNFERGQLRQKQSKIHSPKNYWASMKINKTQQNVSTLPLNRDQQKINPRFTSRNNTIAPTLNNFQGYPQNYSIITSRPMVNPNHRFLGNGFQQNFGVNHPFTQTYNQMPGFPQNIPNKSNGFPFNQRYSFQQNSHEQNFPAHTSPVARNSHRKLVEGFTYNQSYTYRR